jgi:phosphatidylglycerol:prolipoprotein diacylglycerol transferase
MLLDFSYIDHNALAAAIRMTLNPTIVHLGPLQVRWYGLLYVIFLLFAYLTLPKLCNRRYVGISSDDIQAFLISTFLVGVVGARIGYMLTNDPGNFFTLESFKIWHGGLASYGGFAGGLIYATVFTRKNKISFYRIADLIVIPTSFLPCFIRAGNFINGELIGTKTSLPWGFEFPGYDGVRHPVSLYFLLANLVIFIFIWNISKQRFKPGYIFWLWMCLYSSQRFLIDFLREYDYHISGFSVSQIIAIPIVIVSLIILIRKRPWAYRFTLLDEFPGERTIRLKR